MASSPSSPRDALSHRISDLGLLLTGFFAIVVVVAGGSAIALLGWPSHSGTYFSWDLGAAPVAALIGGLYLASVIVFADAITRPRHETWPLRFGILGLAGPTLVLTAAQHDVFDWSRPQAVAWVVLFVSAPVSILGDLRVPTGADHSPKAPIAVRLIVGAVSLSAAAMTVGLWVDPSRTWLGARSPIPLNGLTANYLGAWCSFLAVAALVALVRGRTSDARSIGVLLASVSVGAALAVARTVADLQANTATYLAGLGVLAITATGLIAASTTSRHTEKDHKHEHQR